MARSLGSRTTRYARSRPRGHQWASRVCTDRSSSVATGSSERWGRRGPGYNWSSQVTYRHGLLLAYPPATDREARLLRSVTHSEVSDQGRGAGRGIAAIRRAGGRVRAFPAPLYANTTSAGPRGHQYDSARNHGGRTHENVAPGWTRVELDGNGTIKAISSHRLSEPALTPGGVPAPVRHEALLGIT